MSSKRNIDGEGAGGRSYALGLTLREAILLSLLGAVIAVYKGMPSLDLHLPGHTGIIWIAIMVVGRAVVSKKYAATWVGTMAGLLSMFMGHTKEGPLVFFRYFCPGITFDLFWLVAGEGWLIRPIAYPLAGSFGAVAHLTKLWAGYVAGRLIGVPMFFLTLGLGYSAVLHAVFGFVGGVAAVFIYRKLPDPKGIVR